MVSTGQDKYADAGYGRPSLFHASGIHRSDLLSALLLRTEVDPGVQSIYGIFTCSTGNHHAWLQRDLKLSVAEDELGFEVAKSSPLHALVCGK